MRHSPKSKLILVRLMSKNDGKNCHLRSCKPRCFLFLRKTEKFVQFTLMSCLCTTVASSRALQNVKDPERLAALTLMLA